MITQREDIYLEDILWSNIWVPGLDNRKCFRGHRKYFLLYISTIIKRSIHEFLCLPLDIFENIHSESKSLILMGMWIQELELYGFIRDIHCIYFTSHFFEGIPRIIYTDILPEPGKYKLIYLCAKYI